MIIILSAAFLISLAIVVTLSPIVMRLAHRINALDVPDSRKVHNHPIPRLGGVAIYPAVVLTVVSFVVFGAIPADVLCGFCQQAPYLLLGSFLMVSIGVVDDVRQVRALTKLGVQCVAAGIVVAGGLQITELSNPFGRDALTLGWLGYPLTVTWIVAVTNATNLIDGLDGLASGIGAIASSTIAIFALVHGDTATALLAIILIGALVGFLKQNSHPARMFLGDSGSLFLGFSLACLSVIGSTKGSTAFAFVVPLLAMGLPLIDTFLAIVRRSIRAVRLNPDELSFSIRRLVTSLTTPDKEHIHHRLLALGIPHRQVVWLLYGVSFSLGLGALGIGMTSSVLAPFFAVTTAAARRPAPAGGPA